MAKSICDRARGSWSEREGERSEGDGDVEKADHGGEVITKCKCWWAMEGGDREKAGKRI